MKLKKYLDYLNEASLQGNSGVPNRYLKNAEREAGDMTNRMKRERPRDLQGFMGFVSRAHRLQAQFKPQLEEIAEECIREFYGSILDGVTLNIKFPVANEIPNLMEEPEVDVPDEFKEVEDPDTIREIEKRKILKNFTQGEAKNSKLMLNLPEVRDKIVALMGEVNGNEYLDLLNKITEIASFFDWDIPIEVQKSMWERDKSGFSGAVSVKWEPAESDEEEDPADVAQRILDSMKDGDDIPEEAEDLFNQTTPTINAFGQDFAMLLHEAIKGIYQLIISLSIPENPDQAETVIMNTDTLADELEDLRYGPKFAADLRDFINSFPESDQIQNLREHVVGKLSIMPAQEFLDFMLLFLNGDPKARTKMAVLIKAVQKDFSDYDVDSRAHAAETEEDDDYEDHEDVELPGAEVETTNAGISDEELGGMPDSEIMKLMDQALDDNNPTEYARLVKYLKESRGYE